MNKKMADFRIVCDVNASICCKNARHESEHTGSDTNGATGYSKASDTAMAMFQRGGGCGNVGELGLFR